MSVIMPRIRILEIRSRSASVQSASNPSMKGASVAASAASSRTAACRVMPCGPQAARIDGDGMVDGYAQGRVGGIEAQPGVARQLLADAPDGGVQRGALPFAGGI